MGRQWVGVDLHKQSFTVCWKSTSGRKKTETFSTTKKGYKKFQNRLKPNMEVAVESSGNTGYFYDQISKIVKRVVVINPWKFKIISESTNKTDAKDASTISEFLSKDMLPEIRMKKKSERELQNLINLRDKFVKFRSTSKNKIHGILNSIGIVSKREMFSSKKSLKEVIEIESLSETDKFMVELLTEEIKNLNQKIRELEDKIVAQGKVLKGFESLISITGIGPLSASIILNGISGIERFKASKKLCAYFGMVPRVSDSGGIERRGRITKHGNKIVRTTLVQCTLIAIRYSEYLRKFYDRIKDKKGSGKAIIATARKFLTIIFDTLKNDWVFEDFNNFVLVA